MEEIVLRLLTGAASPEEIGQLERWRAADPANESYYRYLVALWGASRARAAGAGVPSSFEIIRAARQRRRAAGASTMSPPAWRRWAAGAAAAVVLLAVGYGVSGLQSPAPLFAGGVVSTSATEMATVTLGDGTVVRMGPHSSLRFSKKPEQREVWLDGEAFFSVAPAEHVPFRVHTRSGTATALSTRFRVEASGRMLRVGVLEGRVALAVGSVSRELVGGELGRVEAGSLTVERAESPEELRPHLGNFLAFRATPLRTVAQEVEDLYGVQVKIQSAELGGRTVTASFQDASFPEVMSVICRITAARCTIADSVAVVGEDRAR